MMGNHSLTECIEELSKCGNAGDQIINDSKTIRCDLSLRLIMILNLNDIEQDENGNTDKRKNNKNFGEIKMQSRGLADLRCEDQVRWRGA